MNMESAETEATVQPVAAQSPSQPPPNSNGEAALDKALRGVPPEVKAQVLQIVIDSGITDKDDILYQIVHVLGVYATYFESIPSKLGTSIEEKISRLEIIATQIQKTSGDDYEGLKAEGTALISALQEFVILTQSVKTETQAALDKTAGQLKELSEAFSREIKERIVEKTLDELLQKVDSTIKSSKEMLTAAMEQNKRAAEEIAKNSEEVLLQSRSQLSQTYDFNSEKARKFYLLGAAVVTTLLTCAMGFSIWFYAQIKIAQGIQDAQDSWKLTQSAAWDKYIQEQQLNIGILQKLREHNIDLRYVKREGVPFLVVPGVSSAETENGIFIQLENK